VKFYVLVAESEILRFFKNLKLVSGHSSKPKVLCSKPMEFYVGLGGTEPPMLSSPDTIPQTAKAQAQAQAGLQSDLLSLGPLSSSSSFLSTGSLSQLTGELHLLTSYINSNVANGLTSSNQVKSLSRHIAKQGVLLDCATEQNEILTERVGRLQVNERRLCDEVQYLRRVIDVIRDNYVQAKSILVDVAVDAIVLNKTSHYQHIS